MDLFKSLNATEILTLLFMSTDINEVISNKEIVAFVDLFFEIRRHEKRECVIEVNMPMYHNFDDNIFMLTEDKNYRMNKKLNNEERTNKLMEIYDIIIDGEEMELEDDLKQAIRVYNSVYLERKLVLEKKKKEKVNILTKIKRFSK